MVRLQAHGRPRILYDIEPGTLRVRSKLTLRISRQRKAQYDPTDLRGFCQQSFVQSMLGMQVCLPRRVHLVCLSRFFRIQIEQENATSTWQDSGGPSS